MNSKLASSLLFATNLAKRFHWK